MARRHTARTCVVGFPTSGEAPTLGDWLACKLAFDDAVEDGHEAWIADADTGRVLAAQGQMEFTVGEYIDIKGVLQ